MSKVKNDFGEFVLRQLYGTGEKKRGLDKTLCDKAVEMGLGSWVDDEFVGAIAKRGRISPREIKKLYNENACGNFFNVQEMAYFGDTMNSYGSVLHEGELYMYRKPSVTCSVFGQRKKVGRRFFMCWHVKDDGDLNCVRGEMEQTIFDLDEVQ